MPKCRVAYRRMRRFDHVESRVLGNPGCACGRGAVPDQADGKVITVTAEHDAATPKPVAFMVMPFGVKPIDQTNPEIPATVDFDDLWERVYQPALEQIGYEAVRADRDAGALIINEMIQRLAIADLVVADVTLPNANVYYELGVRHAAQEHGCVLVAADWAQPMFDLAQMRQLRFPLPDGAIPPDQAECARTKLINELKPLIDGTSPVFEAVTGYPDNIEPSLFSAFRCAVDELSGLDANIRAVRLLPASDRPARARAIVARYSHQPAIRDNVAYRLARLLRDTARDGDDWEFLLDYIAHLPARLARHPLILEWRALALAKNDQVPAAAAALEQLIATHGGTSERYGLLGGRYKELMLSAATSAERRRYLNKAIESYEQGLLLDMNDYYPASNLPRLYRQRGAEQDLVRAAEAAVITTEACRRALILGRDDEWIKATLLGMAFYRGDATDAQSLLAKVEEDGPGAWQLQATIRDLGNDIELQTDPKVRADLTAVLDALRELLPTPAP